MSTERIRVKVTIDTDELREWADRHADAGRHGVAHVLYKAASEGESLGEQALREARDEALAEAAAWVANGIGYPVQVEMPDHPMPQALWDALVTHIHADESGEWHGNTLDREDTEWWLADEAGRITTDPRRTEAAETPGSTDEQD